MLFHSPDFLPFFVVVFGAYWLLPWQNVRTWLLLVASFYFYATWNHWLALLIGVSSAADYLIGRGLDATEHFGRRKGLVAFSIVMNLGLLAYFKYANFFLDSLEAGLRAAGASVSLPTLQVILPVGISFYTFEAINYTMDVYQRRVQAERRLDHFLLFITFFPHLVAGPIVRARDFLPQITRPKRWSWTRLQLGAHFFLLGLFKKLVIADRLATLVDPVFAAPDEYKSQVVWLAVVSYAIQIYCDFSGYTDMAIGLAHAFGFKLSRNFDMPYLAANISEFWRRWHISLSSWLRDYLFIPLGGSRGTSWQTVRNLMLTMTLGGLWHGATWTFVGWGVLHGFYLVVHRQFQSLARSRPALAAAVTSTPGTALRIAATFLAVCLGWVLFRAPTFESAWTIFERLAVPTFGKSAPLPSAGVFALWAMVAVAHLVGEWRRRRPAGLPSWPPAVQGLAYALAWTCLLLLIPGDARPFIYFQF